MCYDLDRWRCFSTACFYLQDTDKDKFCSVESEALEKEDVSGRFEQKYGCSIYNIESYVPAFFILSSYFFLYPCWSFDLEEW